MVDNHIFIQFEDLPFDEGRQKTINYCKYWISQNKIIIDKLIDENKLTNYQLNHRYEHDYNIEFFNKYNEHNIFRIKHLLFEIKEYEKILSLLQL